MDITTIIAIVLVLALLYYVFLATPRVVQQGGDDTGALMQLSTNYGPEDSYLMTDY